MALSRPSDANGIEAGAPGLSDARLGSVAEDRVATRIVLADPGIATAIAEKMRPYSVPTAKLGLAVLERLSPK
jgi:hypothetical protein